MITDDELLLYHYRDGLDTAERARIGAALSEQPELAQRLQSLVSRLDAAAAMPEVPVPAHIQQRWQDALSRSARNDEARGATYAPRSSRLLFELRWPAAAAAVAIVALVLVFQQPAPDPDAGVAATQEPPASAYERGLKWHLASTERQLAGLGSATPEERARLIETIIAQNRIYALAAERAGEPQLARVLRAFGPVLEELEHGDGATSASGIAQLTFELRVMQGRLAAGTDSTTRTTL
jgi:hypothetical protein